MFSWLLRNFIICSILFSLNQGHSIENGGRVVIEPGSDASVTVAADGTITINSNGQPVASEIIEQQIEQQEEVVEEVEEVEEIEQQVVEEEVEEIEEVEQQDIVEEEVITVVASARDRDVNQVVVLNNEDSTGRQFHAYTLKKEEQEESSTTVYEFSEADESYPAMETLKFDGILVARDLITRLRDSDYQTQVNELKSLLNADTPENFTKLLLGEGGGLSQFRGLLEFGRDATDANISENSQIISQRGVTGNQISENIFASGYLSVDDGRFIKISDVIASGIEVDANSGRIKLLKATTAYLAKEALDQIEGLSEEDKETTIAALCSAECNISSALGDGLAQLVQLAAYEHSPVAKTFCILQKFQDICGNSTVLQAQLDKYKADVAEGYDCSKDPKEEEEQVIEDEEREEEEEEEPGDDVYIEIERRSYNVTREYARYRAQLKGDEAREFVGKGKFFWVCDDTEENKCEDVDDKTTATYEEIKDKEFTVTVYYRETKDGEDVVASSQFTVNLDCDEDDEECLEAEDEEEDGDERFTWEDFMHDQVFPEEYPSPPPRFQRTTLPPRRGMSVTRAVP